MAKPNVNLLDRMVALISPERGLRRMAARNTMSMLGFGPANEGASAKRNFRAWGVSSGDADADLMPEQDTLRDRTRDLYRNNCLGRGAIRTLRTNVVGSGLRLNANVDRDFLGMTDEQAEAWERNTEREFNLWAETQFADATINDNFYGLQGLAFLTVLTGGDCFALLPWVKRKGCPYDLRVQLVEGDRVCNPQDVPDTESCAGGIETDNYGAPVRYWFRNQHPGSRFYMSSALKWDSVPAFGFKTGRRNVLHLFERERPGQRRGYPYLSPVIEPLKQLGRYTQAELQAAVVSGLFTVFITTENGDSLDNIEIDAASVDASAGIGQVPTGADEVKLGPGAVVGLAPGEKVVAPNPGRPNAAFDPFFLAIVRQIGTALEIPFELLIKHFSASYSASRAAMLEAWKFFRHRRDWLVSSFCAPVYAAWMVEAVVKGRVNAPGFIEDAAIRAAYLGAEWVGPTMGQIDPDKEVTAALKRIDGCLSTRSRESAELTGGDFERIVRRRGREEKMREEYGVNQPVQMPGASPIGGNNAGSQGNGNGNDEQQ